MAANTVTCKKNGLGVSAVRRYKNDELSSLLETVVRPGQGQPAEVGDGNMVPEEGHILFVGPSADFACGVWRGGPGVIPIESYPVDEFCWLVFGDVLLQDTAGDALQLTAGSTFLIPKGFRGSWTMRNSCQKFFSCHGDPASIAALCGEIQFDD
jgi:uncharacterized cupin superfamily protein